MRKNSMVVCVFITVFSACTYSYAGLEDMSKEELIKRLLILEKRVNELEKKQDSSDSSNNIPAASPAPVAVTASTDAHSSEPEDFRVYWKEGLRFDSADGNYKLKLGGRLHNDWYAGDIDGGDFPDGVMFRRARLSLSGILYENVDFNWEYDFAGDGSSKFKSVYMGFNGWDWAKIRVGHFKEPFSLEEVTSDNYITLIERSPMNTLAPSYETGVMLHNEILDKRMTWAAGFFQNTDVFGDGEDGDGEEGDWDLTGRITGLPWYESGDKFLHLGAAYSHREWDGDNFRYRSRGSFKPGDRLVDTATFDAESIDLFGAEAAFVYGPMSLQGEYVHSMVDSSVSSDSDYDSFYVQGSYFITGESRPYKGGKFDRVKPESNFLKGEGLGAWELALRYSWLDLSGTPVVAAPGGELHDITAGLNWYLNPNTRVMWNYIHSEADGNTGNDPDADIYLMRFQIDF